MQLRYISIAALIAEAGGDPWAINKSLQAGSPGQIASLAEVFHRAGRCTSEAQHAFEQARSRFKAAWNRRDGGHPINDSVEVQRVTQSLGTQSLQLPKIGADLENIAASLAEAQKASEAEIAALEAQLQTLDGLIGQAVEMEQDPHLSAEDKRTLDALIRNCERDAIDDTKAALVQLNSIRNGYADGLHNSLGNLRIEGYDPQALHDVDADGSPKPSELQLQALADLRRSTDQAVIDQMGKVRAAQEALNKAMADLYTHGPGSPEGEAANAKLPKLKSDLAHALDDLGKIPDYKDVDPASITVGPDGRFIFTHTVDGQPVQVYGQLKDGAGEFFDQAMGTSYSFSGGKLTGMRTLDPGKVEATPEPLWSAISTAVGGGAVLKAGGQVAWQGLKTLFTREAIEGVTGENVFPRALTGAEERAASASADLTSQGSGGGGAPVSGTTHPGPAPVVEHAPPHPGSGELPPDPGPPAGPHVPVAPEGPRAPVPPMRRRLHPCLRSTSYSTATTRWNPAPSSLNPMEACSIPTTRWRPNPMPSRAPSFPTRTLSQGPFSAVSAALTVRTWRPRVRHSLNCPFRRRALLSLTSNTPWETRRCYLAAGISSNLKWHRGSTSQAEANNSGSSNQTAQMVR